VPLHPLARGLARDLAPALGEVARLRDPDELLDPVVERGRKLLPAVAVRVAGPGVAGVGGRDLDQRRHAVGVLERERHRCGGAHRAAHQRNAIELELVQHPREVSHQVRVLVARRRL